LPIELNAAAQGAKQAKNGLQQRRLAAAIGTEQVDDLAGRSCE
jgi:hypothetical protein